MTHALALLATLASAQSRDEQIAQRAAALKPSLVEMRRDFHMYPELSNREERTARVVAQRLRAMGFDEVRTGVAKHGVVALLKGAKPGPVVAWRADMDALPIDEIMDVPYRSKNKGVKHACGHDVHVAVALGIAEVLAGMRAQLAGSVKFLFQPAEEGLPEGEEGGAPFMIKEGALANPRPRMIFGLHTTAQAAVGTVGYSSGPQLASADEFVATIQGKKSHAAWPHQGTDAVTIGAECVLALQSIRSRRIDPMQPMVLTVGTIHGGDRHNIIAETVTMAGTLRTFNESVREGVRTMMKQTLEGCTAAHGAKYELRWGGFSYPVTSNEPVLAAWSAGVLKRVLGEKNVILSPPVMGAEDFSYYVKEVPGFFYWLFGANEARGINSGNHTVNFDIDEDALVVGVKTGAALLLDALAKP
ncbi:MAG: amidohydrolase [Candidatus Solibacter usitatus]|nr:amidohydrolase [Candidatus Solibacter usitatus]